MSSFSPEDFLLPEAIALLKHHIEANDGNEVLVVGSVNADGFVYEVELFGRGTDSAVPAVLKAAHPGAVIIHNHPGGDIRPSDADITVASEAAEKSVGSYIVDNGVTRIFPIVRWIPVKAEEFHPVTAEEVTEIFAEKGKLWQSYPDYEFRPPQLEMALAATEAVNAGTMLVAEAGTGTGKSFSYLVPALLYVAMNEGRKAVITTSTIALEEQLSEKDIPFLKERLGYDKITVAVLKGRQNYLCLRKYDLFRRGNLDLPFDGKSDQGHIVDEMDVWIGMPHDGSKSAMTAAMDADLWVEICSDEHSCERAKCRFFPQCFFYRSRRRANFAQILLVNHHLLMADVSLRMEEENAGGILPPYDILIIDEAHNLFKSAVSFLGESVSLSGILRLLRRLFNNERGTGLLARLLDAYADKATAKDIEKLVMEIAAFIPYYLHSLIPECMERFKAEKENYLQLDDLRLRTELREALLRVTQFLDALTERLAPIADRIGKAVEHDPLKRTKEEDTIVSLLTEVNGCVRRLNSMHDLFELFFTSSDTEKLVFWGEIVSRTNLRLSITPLDIQRIFVKNIYEKARTIIFTSATLTTARGPEGFDFLKHETGLDLTDRPTSYLHLPGCFDYANALRAFTAPDMPDPNDPEFEEASIAAAADLILASNGGALVLFTSVKHREAARKYFKEFPLPVITQSEAAIASVMKRFRGDINSSLLATDTFWEGIDVKGDSLRNLIIVRLPFRYPSHPFIIRFVANLEARTGEDGFSLFTLPHAILKFKQGVGRLIRTKSDRGVVIVLDRRLMQKSYGRVFLQALPEGITFASLPMRRVTARVGEFFGHG
ncbi:MAG TPA: helicase C-terminal domain-containing protein [bacterium]|nr:helicase C-terminal domain-containing protein [bacterium]